MRDLVRTLRFRLAATGFVAIYVAVLVVFAVVFATSVEDVVVADPEAAQRVEPEPEGTSPWVVATVVALAPVSAMASWWWAGRAVRPILDIQAVADQIDGDGLDRRIRMEDGSTEAMALAASFDRMLDRLDTAKTLQQELIEEASHELRTPLAVLRTNADVLLARPQPTIEGYARGLERSRDTATHLTAIIDELLVDARGRARTIARQPADLVAIAREAIESVRPLAGRRGIALDIEGPERLRSAVDPPSVLRAVTNLIDNAVRYSDPGSEVVVQVGTTDGGVAISVTDHGPGIRTEDAGEVFERFHRGDDAGAGSGLGLTIARHVAIAHGGSLELTSPGPDGDGSRFELLLPIVGAETLE